MASTTSSGAATPRSKLETLSRDDLVRFVKKQVQNLQAAKQKIDALEARIAETPVVGDDGERLQDENDRLREELEALQRANAQNTAQNDANSVELDRMRTQLQASEQTIARVSTLEHELQRLSSAKDELERDKQLSVERESERDGELEELSAALSASDERIRLIDAQLKDAEAEKQRLLDRISSMESNFTEKCQSVVALQEECQLLRTALNDRGEICDEIHDENERLVAELEVAHRVAKEAVERSNKDVEELKRQLAEARDHIQRLVGIPVEEKPLVIKVDRASSTDDDDDDAPSHLSHSQSEFDAKRQQHSEKEDATTKEEEMTSLIVRLRTRVAELEAEQRHALTLNAQRQTTHSDSNVNERFVEQSKEGDVANTETGHTPPPPPPPRQYEEAEHVQLQLGLSQSKEECAKLNADLISLRSELEDRVQTVGHLKREIDVLKDQLASVENELSLSKSAYVDVQAKHESELNGLQETVELLSSENKQLCVDTDLLREKLTELSEKNGTRDEHAQTEIVTEANENVRIAEMSQRNAETETASLRAQLVEQEDHVRSLRSELDGVKKLLREQSSIVDQVTTQCEQRQAEIERLRKESVMYKDQLDSAKEKASTQNVLSLEMADYERSIERLQEELKRSQELVHSKTNESGSIKKELDALRSQKAKTESNLAKLKTAFVKTRTELTTAQTDLEKKTAECDGLADKLQEVTAEVENMKMEVSSSMAGEQQRSMQLETTLSSLQRQLATVHSQRDSLQRQYDDLTAEYETFKTRAHSVLKQQNKTSSEQEQAEEERVRLNKMIVELEKRLQETSVGYRTTQEELAAVQEDYERMSERSRRAQTETDDKLSALQRQLANQRTDYESRLVNESAIVERLQTRLRDIDKEHALTIEKLREAHAREISEVRDQLATAEAAVAREEKNVESNDETPNTPMPPATERAPAEGQEAISAAPVIHRHLHVSHRRMQRSTMDSDDLSGRASRNSIPLEDLLMSDDMSISSTVTSPRGDVKDEWSLKTEKAMRRLEHTTELLHESEATNARLVEQTKLLKDEIRRLERNKEREQHVANCEYLKNVVMKFLAPQPKVNDERPQLIPILTTMLRLGPDEVELLNKIANDGADAGPNAAGWAGYLHRWSGLT